MMAELGGPGNEEGRTCSVQTINVSLVLEKTEFTQENGPLASALKLWLRCCNLIFGEISSLILAVPLHPSIAYMAFVYISHPT